MYCSWLRRCLSSLRQDVPQMSKSAEAAAQLFVNDGYSIGLWGDPVFVAEFTGRAGGLMPVGSVDPAATEKTIVLAALGDTDFSQKLADLAKLRNRGNYVIVFAQRSAIEKPRKAGFECDAVVENHAAEHNGILEIAGRWVVPTEPTANIAALWTWTAEFVGACSRLGKLPTVWQSIRVPGSPERNARFRELKFIAEKPTPVPAGKLGYDYINGLVVLTKQIWKADEASILKAGKLAAESRKAGGSLHAVFLGHALGVQRGCEGDPGLFEVYTGGPMDSKDFVLGVGYDMLVRDTGFKAALDSAVAAGAKRAWSFTDYSAEDVQSIPPGDIYINQRWALGDASVSVPGYDVKILPPSGVIGEFLFWAINAEALTE
jgi:uncharacterized phosphosugar-binding protein